MKLYVMVKTYNLYGGNTSLSLIADYLSDDAPYFGPAINELTVTMHFVSSPPPKKTLEDKISDSQHAGKQQRQWLWLEGIEWSE